MRKWQTIAIIGVLSVLLVCSCVLLILRERCSDEDGLARLRSYCTTVHVGFDMDARDLAGSDEVRRREAADRFGSQTIYHSEQELQLCADRVPDLSTRDACWLARDYVCLAKLARGAADAIQ